MTDDLFSAGFAWTDDAPVSQTAATSVATSPPPSLAREKVGNSHLSGEGVAGVASVAETEGQRLELALSQPMSPMRATPVATPETAVFCGVSTDFLPPIATVATVANWQAGVDRLRLMRKGPRPYHVDSWQRLIADADAFLRLWAADAVACGWDTLDVFGTNPFTWERRLDRTGLMVLLGGAPIQSIDSAGALIGSGANAQTYRRRTKAAGCVPLWAISGRDEDV